MDNLTEDEKNKYLKLTHKTVEDEYELLNKNYYDTTIMYSELKIIEDNIDVILEELNGFQDNWKSWKEIIDYHKNSDWEVIPIFGFEKFTTYCVTFPKLKNIISKLNNLTLFSFSKLCSNTILNPHQGWGKTSNINLRNQFGLIIPEKCGLWVEGEIYNHINNKWITFDDSKYHSAFNNSNEDRIVIIIDMLRPNYVKKGNSNVEIKEELYTFIKDI